MSEIKYPDYSYKAKQILLRNGTSSVTLDNARSLMDHHHFVLAWDGNAEPEESNATLAIIRSVEFTADKILYGVRTCETNFDLKYDNAVYIHNSRCPEVLVKSEAGAFVGRLIGVDYEKGMAVVQCNDCVAQYSLSIVTYIDDVNKDLLGLRKAPVTATEGEVNG